METKNIRETLANHITVSDTEHKNIRDTLATHITASDTEHKKINDELISLKNANNSVSTDDSVFLNYTNFISGYNNGTIFTSQVLLIYTDTQFVK